MTVTRAVPWHWAGSRSQMIEANFRPQHTPEKVKGQDFKNAAPDQRGRRLAYWICWPAKAKRSGLARARGGARVAAVSKGKRASSSTSCLPECLGKRDELVAIKTLRFSVASHEMRESG
eukprot:COSAG06_NODE_1695_length_8658_cov_9.171279_10_plen_119_part_00